jgi:hypothetical protein
MEAPTKTDPSARAIAKPSLTIPVSIAFNGKLFEDTPVNIRVTSSNATAKPASFVAPIGATTASFDVYAKDYEPYSMVGVTIEITRRDGALNATYTETHDLRFLLTPDQSVGANDSGMTCSTMKSLELRTRELLILTRDPIRPPPLPDPDPSGPITLADLARSDGPLSKHPFFTSPFLMPKGAFLPSEVPSPQAPPSIPKDAPIAPKLFPPKKF